MLDKKSEYNTRFFPFLLISLFVITIYIPSFTGEFILDDIQLIEKNNYLIEWHSIGSYLAQEDGYDKDSGGHTGYYRPLINLSYTLDYKIWGMFAPGFRITNLVLHLFTCFLLFSFYILITKNRNIALMLVLIFSIHPVNTETVSWVASRNNILVTLFGILSLIFYIRAYQNRRYHEYILSIIFFTLSIFSKEFGLMLLPVFFIYQRILNSGKESLLKEFREYAPFVLIAMFYFFFRQNVIESLITPAEISNLFMRIFNAPYVLLLNLRLIFFPFKLHSFYLKYPESLFNLASLTCFFGFVAIIISMWYYRKNRIRNFSIIAFFILVFPVLNIIPTSAPSLLAMRWLYFPLPFILLVLTPPIEKLHAWNKKIMVCLFTGVIFYLGINTYTLNRYLWHSVEEFFIQEALHFKNIYYFDGMGFFYGQENKIDLAMKYHEKSIKQGIRLNLNYIEYAELLLEKNNPEKALDYLDKAWNINFSRERLGRVINDKGVAYLKLNKLDEAERNILQALNFSPHEPVYWENLGVVQGIKGRHQDAIESFTKALGLGIESESIFRNLANGYISNNECQKAMKLIKRINRDEKNTMLNVLFKKAEECPTEENSYKNP